MVDPAALGELALTLAVSAADLVARRRGEGVEVAATKSSSVDIVTATDREVESFLRAEIARLRPGDGFIGEEGDDTESATGVSWVVDPIDGTVNFFYGLPRYAVCVAAAVDGVVVAGAVVNAATGTRFHAVKGGGAFRDGEPISVRPHPSLGLSLVMTGFSYRPEIRELQGRAVARMLPQVRDVRRFGSAALDLCDVAAGRADAYLEEGLHWWDYAAAGLIVEEAGARLLVDVGVGGGTFVLAAPSAAFGTFVALARECGFLAPEGADQATE